MDKKQAITTLYEFHEEKISDIYDDNEKVRSALSYLFPNFEYPDFSHLQVSKALLRYFNSHRFQIPLGKCSATMEAGHYIQENEINPALWLDRHAMQDWGNLDDHDNLMNFMAVHIKFSHRLLSSYNIDENTKIWVITYFETMDTERYTILMFPHEY